MALVAWAGAMTGTAQATVTSTNTTNDSTNITYVFQYSSAGSYYRAYLDSDANAATGFPTQGVGADYLLEDGFLYRYVGPGWAWTQIGAVSYSNSSNTARWTFGRSAVSETNCTTETAKVVFEVEAASGALDDSTVLSHAYVPCASAVNDAVTTNDASNVYYSAGYSGSWTYFQVFLDTDQNASTGYATGGLGADYFVENGTLYQHTGSASSWTWTNLGTVTYTNTGSSFGFTVPRASIGETLTNEGTNLFYRLQSSSTSVQLPVYNEVYFGSSGGSGGSGGAGTIVPLYSYPGTSPWSAIVAAKKAHPTVPVVAIVNPNNGPGTSVDANYTSGIASLQAAGITVIGYVATGYAGRAESAVQADVAAWRSFYPAVTGIFFDEMDNRAGNEAFYTRQSSYARGQGFTYTVGNPGTDTLASYVGTVDTILIYEKDGLGTLPTWYQSYPASNFGVIPYDVTSFSSAAQSFVSNAEADHIGYIYLTDDTMPNPWDTLSSYFSSLLGYLE
jgi:hypothetical protein